MTYTEDALVEQPALKLFADLGWEIMDCWEEGFGEDSVLGRENRGDMVLVEGKSTLAAAGLWDVVASGAIKKIADSSGRSREEIRGNLDEGLNTFKSYLDKRRKENNE